MKAKLRAPRPQTLRLPAGLDRAAAWKLCIKRARRDFRGMKYDAKTGIATLI